MENKYMAGWLWIMQIVGLTKGYFEVPLIPGSVSEGDVTFLDIWNMELNHDISLERSVMKPGTILTPNDVAMIGLVPMDGPHPLYDDDEESTQLRKEFLLDHMALEVVNEDDPRMEDPEGLTVMNMNGKSLNFHKTHDGSVTVNGLLVQKIKTLADDTVIYEVDDLLFNHQDQVAEAFEAKTLSDSVAGRSEKLTASRHRDELNESGHHDEVTESRHNESESLHDEVTKSRRNDSESLHDEVTKSRHNDKVTESLRNVKVTEGRHGVTETQDDKATKSRHNEDKSKSLHDGDVKTLHNEKVTESRRNVKVTEGPHDPDRQDDKLTGSRHNEESESLHDDEATKSRHNDKVTESRRNVKVTEGRHNDEETESLHNEVIESQRNEEAIGRQEDAMKEDHKHSQCFAGK
ncbi:golgin subfamily A member 6-like protein 22 isoform X2 [Macrobrachium rosenbergii]|uniref:golgin subfamily A member 6-like protein 22 isoform X2 n=1 Tax=Macrobrachium rosenbergii TaxID=79674 RepID=UPI0034D5BBD6